MRALALQAIEEAACAVYHGPVKRSPGLALALASLLYFGKPGELLPRWPFESFWRDLECEKDHDRCGSVTAATNAIYLALGEQRP